MYPSPATRTRQLPALKATPFTLLEKHQAVVHSIAASLKNAKRVLIGTHAHPDGDAIGSSLALLHTLEATGKHATAYIPDPAPEFLQFLPGFDRLTIEKPDSRKFDVIILLDYTQLNRTNLEAEFRAHPLSISIDHHYDNPQDGKLNLVVAEAAATAQILTELFIRENFAITPEVATCLLTGIFEDTGSFMHDSTSPDILKLAAELMSRGARLSHIAHETYQKKNLASLRIWGKALSNIMMNEETGAAVSIITAQDLAECSATLDDLSGVVSMINTLPQSKFSMLLCEYEPGRIKGSLRSEPHKGIDVSKIAKRLGGGGHRLASGFEVKGHLVQQEGKWRVIPT